MTKQRQATFGRHEGLPRRRHLVRELASTGAARLMRETALLHLAEVAREIGVWPPPSAAGSEACGSLGPSPRFAGRPSSGVPAVAASATRRTDLLLEEIAAHRRCQQQAKSHEAKDDTEPVAARRLAGRDESEDGEDHG